MQQLGVIGLGTMGANLARNAARNGAQVVVYNRTTDKMKEFLEKHGSEGTFVGTETYKDLVGSMQSPRAILLMVKAGPPVDELMTELMPLLSKGDILIDAGNSLYADTERRVKAATEKGIRFVGMGVSGGEEGALNGPSMMPGGDASGYKDLEPLLKSMSADDGDKGKCVAFVGPDGAGHFVKMVHNGIEYAIMQLIAESYDVFKSLGAFTNPQLAETFAAWNEGDDLRSFLVEITAKIFAKKEDGKDLIDLIGDAAGQKGTGKWTTEAAMTLGVAIPTINAAVDARILSGSKELRDGSVGLPQSLDETETVAPHEQLRSMVRSALELSTLVAYQQGFELMLSASKEFGWKLSLSEMARIWRGGCIIRSSALKHFQNAYSTDVKKSQAGLDALQERFKGERQHDWRHVIDLATSRGVPVPAMVASLSYYDSVRRKKLPQNLIQAQRDFFGAHTYQRTDKEGTFHSQWKVEN